MTSDGLFRTEKFLEIPCCLRASKYQLTLLYLPSESRIIHTFNIRIFVCKSRPFNGLTFSFNLFTRPKPEEFLVSINCPPRTQTSPTVGTKTLPIFTSHFRSFSCLQFIIFLSLFDVIYVDQTTTARGD